MANKKIMWSSNYNNRCNERNYNNQNYNYNSCENYYIDIDHVHEYESSTKLAEDCPDRHNHRVAGVTGEAILCDGGRNHVHKINDNTDYVDHHHEICESVN